MFDEKIFKFGRFAPLPRKGKVVVTKPPVKRAAIKVNPDSSWVDNPNGVTELDYRLLGESLSRRVITGSEHKRQRTSGAKPLLAAMTIAAIVGLATFKLSSGAKASDEDGVTSCSGTPEGLAHVDPSSISQCRNQPGQTTCDLVCQAGYGTHGTLRCGPGISPGAGDASCTACLDGTFSDGWTPCQVCTVCPRIATATAACTRTSDTECTNWVEHPDSKPDTWPVNASQHPWHLPQFSSVWSVGTTQEYSFGGISSATPPAEDITAVGQSCPLEGERVSNELWRKDRDTETWELVYGANTKVQLPATSKVGSFGWPKARSAAAVWDIPTHPSQVYGGRPTLAAIFSGAFPPPCVADDHQQMRVETLLNPSDMWIFVGEQQPQLTESFVSLSQPWSQQAAPAQNMWVLLGGEQSWAEEANQPFVSTMAKGYTIANAFGEAMSDTAQVMWPLGRNNAQTWFINGEFLMFSGAMEVFRRAPGDCEGGNCMVKNAYLLNDYWKLVHLFDDIWNPKAVWKNGGGIVLGTSDTARPQQPGPRMHAATWTSRNAGARMAGETAWLFGGVGSLFSEGGGVVGSAVAVNVNSAASAIVETTDADGSLEYQFHDGVGLNTLCDLWSYTEPQPGTDADLQVSPWRLRGSCTDDAQGLARAGVESDNPETNMLLREAVLATTWTDAENHLWLFGGASCKTMYDFGSGPIYDRSASVLCEDAVAQRLNVTKGPATGAKSVWSKNKPTPCKNDLWRFDTTTLEWTAFTYAEHVDRVLGDTSSRVKGLGSWPAAECGATALAGGAESVGSPVVMVGGWRDGAFRTCESPRATSALIQKDGDLLADVPESHPEARADCLTNAWSIGELTINETVMWRK